MASGSPLPGSPLLKVSRPIAACARCRGAKIKCDGKLPACTACERAGKAKSCQTKSDEFARGKERSYVASLETQCERLEEKLEAARRYKQGAYTMNNSSPENDLAMLTATPATGARAQRKEASDIDDLVGDFGFLSVNATSRDFHGISSSTSFAGLLLAVASAKPLPRFHIPETYPPRPSAVSLVQHYFDYIYTTAPFLMETNFWTSMDAIYQDGGRFASSFDHWVVRMVLAIALASQSQTCDSEQRKLAATHVSAAIEHAEVVLHPGSVAGIQSILLLTQYSMFDPEHFKNWYLIGMAARVAVDLGVHQEQASEVYQDWIVRDLRRRNFHIIYSLDRYISTSLGRAFSFSDDSANTPLPASTSLPLMGLAPSQPNLFLRDIEPALRLLEVRQLLSDAYQKMFFSSRNAESIPLVPMWELCAKAGDWLTKASEDLPDHLSTQFRLEYCFTLIVLLSPSNIYPNPGDFNRLLILEIAVEFLSHLHQSIVNPSSAPLIVTFVDMQRASLVCNKFLDIIRSSYRKIFYGPIPNSPSVPEGSAQPLNLTQTVHDRRRFQTQVLMSVYAAHTVFEYARTRWATQSLLEEFVSKAAPVRNMLEQEQQQRQYGDGSSPADIAQADSALNVRQLATTGTMTQGNVGQPSSSYNISPEQQTGPRGYPPQ